MVCAGTRARVWTVEKSKGFLVKLDAAWNGDDFYADAKFDDMGLLKKAFEEIKKSKPVSHPEGPRSPLNKNEAETNCSELTSPARVEAGPEATFASSLVWCLLSVGGTSSHYKRILTEAETPTTRNRRDSREGIEALHEQHGLVAQRGAIAGETQKARYSISCERLYLRNDKGHNSEQLLGDTQKARLLISCERLYLRNDKATPVYYL